MVASKCHVLFKCITSEHVCFSVMISDEINEDDVWKMEITIHRRKVLSSGRIFTMHLIDPIIQYKINRAITVCGNEALEVVSVWRLSTPHSLRTFLGSR